jgi:hypothetical protein
MELEDHIKVQKKTPLFSIREPNESKPNDFFNPLNAELNPICHLLIFL